MLIRVTDINGRPNLIEVSAITSIMYQNSDDDNIPREEFWGAKEREVKSHKFENAGWVNVYHYFTENKIRPFIGLGAGLYHVIYHRPLFNLGIRPLVGVSFFHIFALSLEYNRILANIKLDPNGRGTFDNYYLAVKGSFSIGVYKSKK